MEEFKKEYLDIVLNHMLIQASSIINDLKYTESDPKAVTKIALSASVILKPAFEYLKAFGDNKIKDAVMAMEEYLRDGIYLNSLKLSKVDHLFLYRIGNGMHSFTRN